MVHKYIIFPLVLVFVSLSTFATPPPQAFQTVQNGDWSDAATWGQPNGPSCRVNGNDDVVIRHDVTVNNCSNFSLSGNGDVTVQSGAELVVDANVDLSGNGDFEVESGADLEVKGDLSATGNADFDMDGTAKVHGDLNKSGNASEGGIGTIEVGGTGCSNWEGPGPCKETALPVQIVNFEAEKKPDDKQVVLHWETTGNDDVQYFLVQRSKNGKTFATIDTVRKADHEGGNVAYGSLDKRPLQGTSYYRLVQLDGSGEQYSNTREVHFVLHHLAMHVAPNPSHGKFNVSVTGDAREVVLVLFDSYGHKAFSKVLIKEHQELLKGVDLRNRLDPGVYYIKAASDHEMVRKRIVIR